MYVIHPCTKGHLSNEDRIVWQSLLEGDRRIAATDIRTLWKGVRSSRYEILVYIIPAEDEIDQILKWQM